MKQKQELIPIDGEVWKDIEGYEGYKVSNLGNVWSDKTNRYLTLNNNNGYCFVVLYKDGIRNPIYVHRLVAEAFIPNLENKPYIDHINTARDDNRVENLRWVTSKENANNPISLVHRSEVKIGVPFTKERCENISKALKGKGIGDKNPRAKEVVQISKDGELVRIWSCIKDAEDEIGTKGIYSCLGGKCNTSGGYRWMYKKDWEAR